MNQFLLLAQEGGAGAPGGAIFQFAPLVLIAVVFYFLMIRPQSQERKRREETLKALKKNDRVVTVGGIIGTIADLSSDGNRVTLKVDDNTRFKMQRSSVQGLFTDEDSEN